MAVHLNTKPPKKISSGAFMGNSMPLSLVASWVVFFGFVNTHQRHARHFRGESQGYLRALQASVLLGSLVGLGLLGYYFTQVAWYMPIALFAIGSLVGGASVWCAGCKNQSAWHEHGRLYWLACLSGLGFFHHSWSPPLTLRSSGTRQKRRAC